MDLLSAGASLITFIELADRVIGLCKFYIEGVRDAPHDLRVMLIEVTSLRGILENLDYLLKVDPSFVSEAILNLWCEGGTIAACEACLTQLKDLFPKDNTWNGASKHQQNGSKRQKISHMLAVLAWPLKEGRARKLLQELSRHKTTVTLALSAESSRDIKDVKKGVEIVQEVIEGSERRKFYEWLEWTNPSDLHVKACDLHQKDTGLWMLESQDWRNWINRKTRCLWLHGIPGSGKTIMASPLIQNVHPNPKSSELVGSIYYYCYFGHNQDETIPLLGWIIGQLCRQAGKVPDSLLSIYKNGRKPNTKQLLEGLADILDSFVHAYVVIDALDESKEPRDQILGVLKLIAIDPRFSNIQLLVTSREYFDIESVMTTCSVSVPMQMDQVQADIWKYVNTTLQGNRRFLMWPEELRQEVQTSLAVQAKGMFRWAVCQIDILRRLSTTNDIRRALSSLPETLDETYERIFALIPVHERHIVQRALALLCKYDTLRIIDNQAMPAPILLCMTLENWDHRDGLNNGHIFNLDMLKEACGCLVTISAAEKARLAHFTVHEFLFSSRLMTTNITGIREFALSHDLVNYTFMRTALIGVLGYVGPVSSMVDCLEDLYDFLLVFGFYTCEKYIDLPWVGLLRDLVLRAWAPGGRPFERLQTIYRDQTPSFTERAEKLTERFRALHNGSAAGSRLDTAGSSDTKAEENLGNYVTSATI